MNATRNDIQKLRDAISVIDVIDIQEAYPELRNIEQLISKRNDLVRTMVELKLLAKKLEETCEKN